MIVKIKVKKMDTIIIDRPKIIPSVIVDPDKNLEKISGLNQ